jgi:uncharacterized protein
MRLLPRRRPGEFVFVSVTDRAVLGGIEPLATVVEDEGLSAVLRREDADGAGHGYDYLAAWITLETETTPAMVGITAAVSGALADAGISCNVLAGARHDHLLVPVERAEEALGLVEALRPT